MALVLAPWFCNGFVTMEIGIGILVFLVRVTTATLFPTILDVDDGSGKYGFLFLIPFYLQT
jgi:hypothetical protein